MTGLQAAIAAHSSTSLGLIDAKYLCGRRRDTRHVEAAELRLAWARIVLAREIAADQAAWLDETTPRLTGP